MATFDLVTDPSAPICSRAGCRETALFRVNWRNPRIHAADRVKVWAACEEHRTFLADYLRSRAFPVRVTGIDEDVDRLEDASDGTPAGSVASDRVSSDRIAPEGVAPEAPAPSAATPSAAATLRADTGAERVGVDRADRGRA